MSRTIRTYFSFRCVALFCVLFFMQQASAQNSYIYADKTILAGRGIGNNEFELHNGTRGVLGALVNVGGGVTQFKLVVDTAFALNDSTTRYHRTNGSTFDITIHSSGSGGGITVESDPVATAKTITITGSSDVPVTGGTQTIGANPSFTLGSVNWANGFSVYDARYLTASTQNEVISGGKVTWLHDYVYNVSAATYLIDGVNYSSPSTDITLSTADATDDRIDVFVLTTSNTAIAITGTPSTPAVEPAIDANTQLQISFADVNAGSTSPTLNVDWIYQENTEWPTATSSPGTVNLSSTNTPYAGSKDIEGTSVANNTTISFTSATTPTMGNYQSLVFQIKSKANWSTTKKWVLRFFNGTTAIGNPVNFGSSSYGFVSTSTSQYQTITIPLSDFGSISTATKFVITQSNSSGTIGWFLDNVQLQGGGGGGTPSSVALVNDVTGTGTGTIPTTVVAIRNKSIPTLAAGNLKFNGTIWVFDNNTYLTGNQSITISGDATGTGTTSIPLTLATVNSSPGTYGSASQSLTGTVNGKGLITSLSAQNIQIAESQVTNLTTDLAAAGIDLGWINVKTYAATVGDGKIIWTAGMVNASNVVTAPSGTFSLSDVGKVIDILGAGVSGRELVGTITSYISSTQVGLSVSASTTVSNSKFLWGSDNTTQIQQAINDARTQNKSTIYFPNSIYVVAGALQTSVGGVNPNCQIYVPSTVDKSDSTRGQLRLLGEGGPTSTPNGLAYDFYPPKTGTILWSTITGSGTAPSVFGGMGVSTMTNDEVRVELYPENMTVMVSGNTGGGGPTMSGFNCRYFSDAFPRDLLITTNQSILSSVSPTNEVAGFIFPQIDYQHESEANNLMVDGGFKYGIVTGEHTHLIQSSVYDCYYGFVPMRATHAATATRITAHWNKYELYCPNTSTLGITSGYTDFSAFIFDIEAQIGTGRWNDQTNAIYDPGNNLHGFLFYLPGKSGVGIDNTVWTVSGASNFKYASMQSIWGNMTSTAITDLGSTITSVDTNANKVLVRNTTTGVVGQMNWLGTGTGAGGTSADIQTFTADGTWTRPTGAKTVYVLCIGSGGAGGSGAKEPSGTTAAGGAGGGGGGYTFATLRAADLTATVAVVVPAAASGGASQATNSTSGSAGGTKPNPSSFGTYVTAEAGNAGPGGTTSGVTGSTGGPGMFAGTQGGNGSLTTGGTSGARTSAGSGGGGGGGNSATPTASAGGASQPPNGSGLSSAAGGTVGNSGAAGATNITGLPSTGGGGGGASITGNAGAGGNGGSYGGGGGGGGAALNGVGNSGAGGNGGPGIVVVITYF